MNAVVKQADDATAAASEPGTMLAVISRAASDPSVNMDKLERLLAMKERLDAQQAEQDFNAAMVRAQTAMRPISADAENPQTRSRYATYSKLDNALRPIYTREGFSLSFNTTDSPKDEHVRVLCYASHSAGHTRTYQVDMPADGKGAKGNDVMTRTHATGAAVSYGTRYLLKMIFNVAIGEDDRDGNEVTAKYMGDDYADWRAAVDQCKTAEDFAKVWKEMKPQVRAVMSPYVQVRKSEKVPG
jgi:hypothetical protein